MVYYGVVSGETEKVVDFFLTREEAEQALREAVRDEPRSGPVLRVAEIDLGRPSPHAELRRDAEG